MQANQRVRNESRTSAAVTARWLAVAPPNTPANDRPSPISPPGVDAVAVLYGRHHAAVRARCRQLLRNDAAAADAAQETFVRVLRHVHRLPPEAEALSWLYRIATNHCLNELRHLRIAAAVELDEQPLRDTPPSPEESVSHRQLLHKVLAPIPAKMRQVGVLRHAEGLLDAEIAATLRVSRRTVVYRMLAFRQRATASARRLDD